MYPHLQNYSCTYTNMKVLGYALCLDILSYSMTNDFELFYLCAELEIKGCPWIL